MQSFEAKREHLGIVEGTNFGSYAKFWQMIGRGTRLCPDLFGPKRDKEHFLIFDFCQNFEFFNENPDGVTGTNPVGLTQGIFGLKLDIVVAIRDKQNASPEEKELGTYYANQLKEQVKALDQERFQVRMELRHVVNFSHDASWGLLDPTAVNTLKTNIAKLLIPDREDHELSRRFDILMLNLKLAMVTSQDGSRFIVRVATTAGQLKKVNVPDVSARYFLLEKLQTEAFWNTVNVKRLEEVRILIRELMKFLETTPTETVYSSFEDDILIHSIVEEVPLIELSTKLQSYKDRVETYIRKNKDHLTMQKLRSNVPITKDELIGLEEMLFDGDERGSKVEFEEEYGSQPLGVFIRSILGLDIQAANQAFSGFIQNGNLRADQMTFIQNLISFLEKNGTIDKAMLFESPFTDINDQGLLGVFDDADAYKVISIIDVINGNAQVA